MTLPPPPPFRTGIGYDVHRLAPGRPCVLGGVEIPHDRGPDAHSDGDVALHALMDALLGAAALGDIGALFPPSDATWKNADSRALLRIVRERLDEADWSVGNVDLMIIAEAPRVGPHVPAMRERIAEDLGVDPSCVSIKATTNEAMGFVGRGEGVAALATALILRAGQQA